MRFLSVFMLSLIVGSLKGQVYSLANESIEALVSSDGMSRLSCPADSFQANAVGHTNWGRAEVIYRVPGGQWLSINTYNTTFEVHDDQSVSIVDDQPGMPVVMEERFSLVKEGIDLDITVKAAMQFPIEIGDLAIHLPWNAPGGGNQTAIFERGFTKHHFIAGDGSFVYFTRPSGKGPFLMVLPCEGTRLEYYTNERDQYKVYIHSFKSGNDVTEGTWRQPFTSKHLNSPEYPERQVTYGVKFRWADTWAEMREVLYREGLLDIRVVPGMTIPTDLEVRFSLHTREDIRLVTAEFPDETTLTYLGEPQPDHHLYQAVFRRLGENMLTVHHGAEKRTVLEFFVTEPLETLVKKRSNFIVQHQQHRDSTKWYDGLYSVYDMKNGVLRGPDNTDGFDGWWGYVLASDDPGLCKAPYVAAKNVYFPNEEEIASVEYYLKNYVWNGLQRTDRDDPYPYGIYGVPNWKVARDPLARAGTRSRQLDRMQVWRSYDYPHIVMLYYHMYQIARKNPDKVHYLDAAGYLERAWQTARAYFIYPYEIFGEYYETYKQGCYNELVIEDLIADLESEGRQEEADWLRHEYEKKVKYFIYDDAYPYGSEYAFDRTAFESSYAFAKYGYLNEMKTDSNLWYDQVKEMWRSHPQVSRQAARAFMDRQHDANLAVRGWLETKYFLLGSDFNGSSDHHALSYMAKMGGWSILDYGINFAENPADWLQLGYASYLSSWALMNTGTAESNYGYWFPGKENDGAMGWAFTSLKHAGSWIQKDMDRGAWFYDGEADLGNGAAIRMATTVLTNDPLFGWVSYGGSLEATKKGFKIIPRDGVRSRLAVVTDHTRLHLKFEADGFRKDWPIVVSSGLNVITFTLENREANAHTTRLFIENYSHKTLTCSMDDQLLKVEQNEEGTYFFDVPVTAATHEMKLTLN